MKKKEATEKFKEMLKDFLIERIKYRIKNGELDDNILDFSKDFLNGDSYELVITHTINLHPNDVFVMRRLLGLKTPEKLMEKIWGKYA